MKFSNYFGNFFGIFWKTKIIDFDFQDFLPNGIRDIDIQVFDIQIFGIQDIDIRVFDIQDIDFGFLNVYPIANKLATADLNFDL